MKYNEYNNTPNIERINTILGVFVLILRKYKNMEEYLKISYRWYNIAN